jgi:hypothetical protein
MASKIQTIPATVFIFLAQAGVFSFEAALVVDVVVGTIA